MKRLIYILFMLLLVSALANGQKYSLLSGRYQWRSGWFDSTLRIPHGPAPFLGESIFTDEPGALFYNTTDSSLYVFNGSAFMKVRGAADSVSGGSSAGGGAFYNYTFPLQNSGGNVTIAGWNKPQWDSAYSWYASNPLSGYATQNYVQSYVGSKFYLTKNQADSLYASSGITALKYSNGLMYNSPTGEVQALYFSPIWNANRIQSYYVDAGRPRNGEFIGFDSSNGVWRSMRPDSVTGSFDLSSRIATLSNNVNANIVTITGDNGAQTSFSKADARILDGDIVSWNGKLNSGDTANHWLSLPSWNVSIASKISSGDTTRWGLPTTAYDSTIQLNDSTYIIKRNDGVVDTFQFTGGGRVTYQAANGLILDTSGGKNTFMLGGRLNNGFTVLKVAPDQSFNWENGLQIEDTSNTNNVTQLGAGVLYSNYEDGAGGNSQIYNLGANFYLNNYVNLQTASEGTASISTGSSANHGYLRLAAGSFNKGSSSLILQSDTAQVLLQATGDGTQTSVFKVTSTRTQNLNSTIDNIYVHDDTTKIGGYYLLVDSLKKQATGYHLAYNPATQRVTYDSTGGSGTTYTTTDKNLLIAGSTISTNKTPLTLTDAATVTWDLSQGYNANVTIAGNRTIALSNPQAGSYYKLTIVQDATGSRTVTWPATVKWKGGAPPTLTTTGGAKDIVVLYYDGSNFQTVYGLDFK